MGHDNQCGPRELRFRQCCLHIRDLGNLRVVSSSCLIEEMSRGVSGEGKECRVGILVWYLAVGCFVVGVPCSYSVGRERGAL